MRTCVSLLAWNTKPGATLGPREKSVWDTLAWVDRLNQVFSLFVFFCHAQLPPSCTPGSVLSIRGNQILVGCVQGKWSLLCTIFPAPKTDRLGGSYGLPGTESGLVTYQVNALPTVLSLRLIRYLLVCFWPGVGAGLGRGPEKLMRGKW